MNKLINLNDFRQARRVAAEKAKIVLMSHVEEAFAEYCECPDDGNFVETLMAIEKEIGNADLAMFEEFYWWAVARRYAWKNHIEVIGSEFYDHFEPSLHHAETLGWASSYLKELPKQYSDLLGGAHE